MRFISSSMLLRTCFIGTILCGSSLMASQTNTSQPIQSYYPHWVTREGGISDEILSALAPGTLIAAHHRWELSEIRWVLDYPEKGFQISWYVEANVEEIDDPAATGTSVTARIQEARLKQDQFAETHGADRFANLIELDGAREKKVGGLSGSGNEASDWLNDAIAAQSAGFRYVAKSPKPAHIRELRQKLGHDFVQRIVFEDVTGKPDDPNPGYAKDAKALAAQGEILTLVIHEGTYGGFPGATLDQARTTVASEFNVGKVEAFWGRAATSEGFVRLKAYDQRLASDATVR